MTQPSLLQSLFDEQERRPLSVAELNAQVKRELEKGFSNVWVEGEITNFTGAKSGHWYFSLNGEGAQIKACCFKSTNWKIKFKPSNGLTVRVRGKLTVYEPRGEYQLSVESLEPIGEGALQVAYEQIKSKLDAEGLFSPALKRKLPLLPKRVGVVTSPTGAAYHDILTVLTRRTRSVSIVLIPTRVQGENSGEEIRSAVLFANRYNQRAKPQQRIDVLIVGRGGGSSEDLWAFNEERLARAVRESLHRLQALSMAPVFTEFPTSINDLRCDVDSLLTRAKDSVESIHDRVAARLQRIETQLTPLSVTSKLSAAKTRLALLNEKQQTAVTRSITSRKEQVALNMTSLDALSPLSVMKRGYSITQKRSGEIVRDAASVNIGEQLNIRVAEGYLTAEVRKTEK